MKFICSNCGKEFSKPRKSKFCSKSCAARTNNKLFPKKIRVIKPKKVQGARTPTNSRTCDKCGKLWAPKRGGSTLITCPSCLVHERRDTVKRKCMIIAGNTCSICSNVLGKEDVVFHHVDPTTKLFVISGNESRSWAKILVELKKCIVLCHKCHNHLHHPNPKKRKQRSRVM